MYLSIFLETHMSDSSLPGVEAGESEAAALGPGVAPGKHCLDVGCCSSRGAT